MTDRVELSGRAREFLQRSVRRDRRRRRRATSILSVLLLLALAGSGVALDRQRAAQEQQRIATARQLIAQAEAARGNDPRAALQLGLAAQSVHPDVDTQASLAATVTGTRYTGTLPGQPAGGPALAFARNSSLLAVGGVEKSVVLWDLTDPLRPLRVGQPLTGYDGVVWSAEFSPDGHILATGTTAHTEVRDESGSVVDLTDEALVILWDVTNPSQARRLGQPVVATTDAASGGEGMTIASVTFSPDGRTLAVNNGSTVGLWDVTDPERPHRIGGLSTGQEGGVSAAVFAPDQPLLATASDDGQVDLWDLADPAHPRRAGPLPAPADPINALAFAPDAPLLATADEDGQVALWDLTNLAQPRPVGDPLSGHVGGIEALAFSPAGHLLASAGSDSTVVLWEVTDHEHVRQLGQPLVSHVGGVMAVAFAPGGATLISSGLDRTVEWDITARAQPRVLPGGTLTADGNHVSAVAFARAGGLLATATDHETVILWDLADPARPRRLGRPLVGGRLIAFSPDGRTLAVLSEGSGRSVILWDLVDPDQPHELGPPFAHTNPENSIQSLAFSNDGHLLAIGGADGTVNLWDVTGSSHDSQDWQATRVGEPLKVDALLVGALAFAPDGATLATASLNTIILWNLADPLHPQRIGDPLPGHASNVSFITFTGDGRTLLTASYDNQVIIWNVADARRAHRMGQPLTGHSGGLMGVAVAPDGRTLATAGEDFSTVVLWDLTNPAQPRQLAEPLSGHRDQVDSIAFSTDGQTLATGSNDGTTLLWDLGNLNQTRDHATERACLIAGGSLGPEEWSRYISGLDYIDTCRRL